MKHNKIVAEFMGYKLEMLNGELYATKDDMLECFCVEEELHYHTSWDWLIPVAQKLAVIKDATDEQDEQDLQQSILNNRIGVVYQIVVELIKKYNNED